MLPEALTRTLTDVPSGDAAVAVVGMQSLVLEGAIDVESTADRLFPLYWSGLSPTKAGTPGAAQ
ncbi:MAG: hypothetical protein Q8K58_11890 [Acidimicrobiales bacterium]|nr:hypothetical protein [Acidimicrobiales bacterium]